MGIACVGYYVCLGFVELHYVCDSVFALVALVGVNIFDGLLILFYLIS